MNPPAAASKPLLLVTGCCGLIGGRLIRSLASDYSIVGFDVVPPEDSPHLRGEDFSWIECDLTDQENVSAALDQLHQQHGTHLASVVHLAAYYDFSGEPSPLYEELTVEGTQRLLLGLKQQFQVEQFIFSSSLLVMEPVRPGEAIRENSSTQAEWEYPESKLAAEAVLRERHGEMPVVILRMAGVFNEDCLSLPIGQQIRRIHEKQFESRFFPGDADRGQAFLHLEDLIDCIRRVIELRGELDPYEVFLVSENDVMSYGELQDQIGEMLHGRQWPTIRIPKAVAKAGAWVQEQVAGEEDEEPFIKPWMVDLADQHYPVDLARCRQRLQWEPNFSLRQTLPEMLTRLKEDPQRWYRLNDLPLPEELKSPERRPHERAKPK